MDVNNAFLNWDPNEEIYMDIPQGYCVQSSNTRETMLVCKLHQSIDGLKQASRQWFDKFKSATIQQSKNDYSLFTKGKDNSFVVILVYVDDIIIAGPNPKIMQDVKRPLQSHFKLKSLGQLR